MRVLRLKYEKRLSYWTNNNYRSKKISTVRFRNRNHYKNFGGRYLIRGGDQIIAEGTPQGNRDVVVEFDTLEKAKQFYESEEYAKIIDIRKENSTGYILMVEGY